MPYLWWDGTKRWIGPPLPGPEPSPDAKNWTYDPALKRWVLEIEDNAVGIWDKNGPGAV